jgi:hypothetical protein
LGGDADAIFASNVLPKPSEFDYAQASYNDFIAERLKLMRQLVASLCDGAI